jgi:hypothetical protein
MSWCWWSGFDRGRWYWQRFYGRRRRRFYGNVRGLALFTPCLVPSKPPRFALFVCEGWSASVALWFRFADRRGHGNCGQKRHKAKAFLGLSPR